MIMSKSGKHIDAAISAILIGPIVVVGFVALIFVTLGEGSYGPDAVMWRAAVSLVLVGCLVAGLLNGIRVIAQIRRRNLEAVRITMASWLGLPSSADAGRSVSPDASKKHSELRLANPSLSAEEISSLSSLLERQTL